MKKTFLFASLILLMLQSKAQNLENPSFDSIYIGGIDRIYEWITSDSWSTGAGDTVFPLTPNTRYVSSGLQYHEALFTTQIEFSNTYHGPNAVKLLSDTDRVKNDGTTFHGFIVNGNHFYTDSTGYIDFSKCGEPFPYRPYSLKGHYKFEDNSPSLHNYPHALVLLKKYNSLTQSSDTIGFAEIYITFFATSTWQGFEIPITYFSSDVPDSVVVAFESSPAKSTATFWIDSLGFDYNFPSGINENLPEFVKNVFQYNREEKKIYLKENINIESINMFDINGKLLLNSHLESQIIDVSEFPNGNYIMQIEFVNNKNTSYKLIIY